MGTGVAYNPDDPIQQAFLSALAQGETGGSSIAATEGTGGVNLAGAATDQYGFPEWNGQGNSHAAGLFQFQPGTWDNIAAQYGLNFQSPTDQAEGAWYLAQQTYAANNGGASLESALQAGQYGSVQSALAKVWTSVTGNASLPQGLAAQIAHNISTGGSTTQTVTAASNAGTGGTTGSSSSSTGGPTSVFGGLLSSFSGGFSRIALIVLGAIVIFVALWFLLSNSGVVPSPRDIVKSL